jgi:hypothetical protein
MKSGLLSAGSWLALLGITMIAAPASGETGSPGVEWQERIEVSSGEGYRGPWRMNESEFRYVDDPAVAITDDGVVGVAWADQARKDVFVQFYEPNGDGRFEGAVNVSRSPEIFSWLPKMVIPPSDPSRVYILWQEIVFSGGTHGGEIFFARSSDGGETFSDPINLSNTVAGAGKGRLTRDFWHNGSLDIVLGPEGNLYAAWTEYEGALRFSRSTDGGESFSDPILISGGDANPARAPSLAAGGRGAVHLAWTHGEDPSAGIHFATSTDHGESFGAPQTVAGDNGHAEGPKIAVDEKGSVHLVYAESPGGPFERYDVRYTRLKDGEDSFDEPRTIAEPSQQWASMNFPGLSLDGEGNPYVIWELFPEPISYPQGLGITYSEDGGRTFASPAQVPGSVEPALGSAGGRQGLLMKKIAVNAGGALAVVHSTFKANEGSHIWLFLGQIN